MEKPKAHEFGYVDKDCEGCDNIVDGRCKSYLYPSAWWEHGKACPMATHLKATPETALSKKKRTGQQKQKKDYVIGKR